jgi:TPR repeat protein
MTNSSIAALIGMLIKSYMAKVFFLISIFASFPVFGDFNRAVEIYDSGDYEKAISSFEALAEIGDDRSLFNLGVMTYLGHGTKKNNAKAYVLVKISNENKFDEQNARVEAIIYQELSETEQTKAASLYKELSIKYKTENIHSNVFPTLLSDEDCTPPIKPKVKEIPVYPRLMQMNGMIGIVPVEYTISPNGYPRDVLILDATNKAFRNSALKAIEKTIFSKTSDDRPIFGYRSVYAYKMAQPSSLSHLKEKLNGILKKARDNDPIAQYEYADYLGILRFFRKELKDIDVEFQTQNKWLIRSAQGGVPNAQFKLGQNMLQGRGCAVDRENGLKWITAAASSGFTPAQNLLARSMIEDRDLNNRDKAKQILEDASENGDFYSMIMLAWELVTQENIKSENGGRALNLMKSDSGNYYDAIRIQETKAAAYAAIGNFSKAVTHQKKALRISKSRKWEIPKISERLSLYQNDKRYVGQYF